jgi:hypothetical protein
MNDHHFSYPVVVPLRGLTISCHSSPQAAPVSALHATGPIQPLVRNTADAVPAPAPAMVALAW